MENDASAASLLPYQQRRHSKDPHGGELKRAGVHCETDTWIALKNAGLVDWMVGEWELTESAIACLGHFTIAKAPDSGIDIRVDVPSVATLDDFVSSILEGARVQHGGVGKHTLWGHAIEGPAARRSEFSREGCPTVFHILVSGRPIA